MDLNLLEGSKQNNVENLYDIRLEASRHLRNEKKEYLKTKINELETGSRNNTSETFFFVAPCMLLRL
jgi:hypothetical protein